MDIVKTMLRSQIGHVALVGTLALAVAIPSNAQTSNETEHSISVKLLDATTGKPVKHIWVPLQELGEKHRLGKPSNIKTNSQGVADFRLVEPLPDRIGFSFAPDEFASCSEIEFVTDRILETGVVGGNRCESGKPKPFVNPAAGLLVIFGKRVTLWQRIFREIP